jgi:hypothetical protein
VTRKASKRISGYCCAPLLLGWLAIAAVFLLLVSDSDRFFDALDELIKGKPTARPFVPMDPTLQAIEAAMLDDTLVNYSAPGCPDSDFAASIEAWGKAVQAVFENQIGQDQIEPRLVEIIDGAGGIAECMASIRVRWPGRGYFTYDQFAHDAYGMPNDVSIVDIYELHWLAKNTQTYLDQGVDLRTIYDDTMQSKPRQAALWLIRRIPVYHSEEGWITFDRYAKRMGEDLGTVNPDSRFEQDPVGTAFDIVTGNYTEADVAEWMGF